jgi:hypothetical protein
MRHQLHPTCDFFFPVSKVFDILQLFLQRARRHATSLASTTKA